LKDSGLFKWETYKKDHTTDNPGGTLHLFMDAALKQDAAEMKKYCLEGEKVACDQLLTEIATVNRTFARYNANVSGGAGNRTGGTAQLWGEKGDLFLVVTFSLENRNGVWYVSTISSRRVSSQ
jgi:hypothetical protein